MFLRYPPPGALFFSPQPSTAHSIPRDFAAWLNLFRSAVERSNDEDRLGQWRVALSITEIAARQSRAGEVLWIAASDNAYAEA